LTHEMGHYFRLDHTSEWMCLHNQRKIICP
jgi:predicted Zn-dependent protease